MGSRGTPRAALMDAVLSGVSEEGLGVVLAHMAAQLAATAGYD